jgi:hypothetical protein
MRGRRRAEKHLEHSAVSAKKKVEQKKHEKRRLEEVRRKNVKKKKAKKKNVKQKITRESKEEINHYNILCQYKNHET